MQTASRQQQNQIRMIDRIMSSDTEYHIATLNRYYPCFKSKSSDVDQVESIKRCHASSSSEDQSQSTQTTQTNSNSNRKVSFRRSSSLITNIHYRPTTSQDDKQTLYYNKEDYEMFIYDEYTERILLEQQEQEEEEEKVFSWEDLLCYEGSGSDYCIHMMADEEEVREGEEGKLMHKVETLKDLLI